MADSMTPDEACRVIGPAVTDEEATALAEWYANLARGLAAYPGADLKGVEPPLRSMPGPRR